MGCIKFQRKGVSMLNKFRASALAVVLGLTCASSAMAAAGPFKVGYLDLEKVKQGFPDAARADFAKAQAESQLRDIVAKANAELDKAAKDKKEPAELEKMKHDFQLQISGMQQAFNMSVMSQTVETNSRIAAASNAVAKEKGLDIVVDVRNVFGGADKLAGCEDVTDAVLKRLAPGTQNVSAAPKTAQ